MSAVLIPSFMVPIARTNADWAMDIAFSGENWSSDQVSVIFARQGLPGYAFEATIGDGLLTPTVDLAVALRIPALMWADAPAATYSVQVRRLTEDAIDDAATFSVVLQKGLSGLLTSPASAPLLSGADDKIGSVIVSRAGEVQVVRGGGVKGDPGLSAEERTELLGAAEAADSAGQAAQGAAAAALEAASQTAAVRDQTAAFLTQSQAQVSTAIDNAGVAAQAAHLAAQQVEDALVGRARKAIPTTSYTVTDADRGMVLVSSFASTVLITIPPDLGGGWYAFFDKEAVGNLYFLTGAGVTLNAAGGNTGINVLHAVGHLVQNGANAYNLVGGTTASGPPGQIQLSAAIVAEDAAIGTAIGTLSVSGSAIGDFNFSLLTDGNGQLGTADANGFHLATVSELDFEAYEALPITVKAVSTIDGTEVQRDFTITITNVTELTDFALSNGSVLEASPAGTLIGSLTSTPPGGSFVLLDDAGGKAALDDAALEAGMTATDYETATGFNVQIRCDRLGETLTKTFPIAVLDKPELTAIHFSSLLMMENSAQGSPWADITTTPPGGAVTVLDSAGGRFQIVANQAQAGPVNANREDAATRPLHVQATLGDSVLDAWVTVAIGDVNEAPTGLTITGSEIVSGSPEGVDIGQLLGVDPDVGDVLSYSVINSVGGLVKTAGGWLKTGATASNADVLTNLVPKVRVSDVAGLYVDVDVPLTVIPALPTPASAELVASGLVLGGFAPDRWVPGWTGATVRLKRLSDNAQQDFGFRRTGQFDALAVEAWATIGGVVGDVDLVKLYDQFGMGREALPSGSVAAIRNGVWQRFATTWSAVDAQLTRSTTEGAIGFNLGDDVSSLRITASGIDQVAGAELHMLWSNNERKLRSTSVAGDPFGGNSTIENILAIGSRSNVSVGHTVGGSFQSTLRAATTAGSSQSVTSEPNAGTTVLKRNAQQTSSYALNGTTWRLYMASRRYQDVTYNATHAANMAAGPLNNGDILIGNTFASTANSTARTDQRANMLFGGLLITKPLTDRQRWFVQEKIALVGQQHRLSTRQAVLDMLDELVIFRKVEPATGLVTGEKGKLTLQFNKSVVTEGTPTWNFAYEPTDIGLRGIYSPSANAANGFKATTNYFAGVTTGTWFMLSHLDVNAPPTNLAATVIQGTGNPYGPQNPDWSFGLGHDHSGMTVTCMFAGSRDPSGLMGRRHKEDESEWDYDQSMQSVVKYNRNTPLDPLVYTETQGGMPLTLLTLANAAPEQLAEPPTAPYYRLDAPIVPRMPDNIANVWKRDALMWQFGTFRAPGDYNRADPYSVRKTKRLKGVTKNYACPGNMPIGHLDGSIAINPNAGVVDSADNATIMSHQFQSPFYGTRFALGTALTDLTVAQIETIKHNYFRFEEAF